MRGSLTIIGLVASVAGVAFCQRPEIAGVVPEKDTLKGFPSMSVAFDMSSLPESDFRPQVENVLRQGGISVLRATENPRTYPLLRVTIGGSTIQRLQQLNYLITLQFVQLLRLGDGRQIEAVTWSNTRAGLTPWANAFSASQAEVAVQRDVGSMLTDFVQVWKEANGQPGLQGEPATFSGSFNGVWRGSYSCSGGSSGGTTVWVIREVKPGVVQVQETWTHFLVGRNNYAGTISGKSLDVKTHDMGGYEVRLALSEDGRILNGRYIGHPNYCETINLRKSQ